MHGLRETWKKNRTQRINLLRGLLREAGIGAPTSTVALTRAISEQVDQPEFAPLSRLLHIALAEISLYEQCMAECEQQPKRWHVDDDIVRELDEVSDTGLLTASALTVAVGGPERSTSGRQPSIWLGMTPRKFSSSERRKLGHISRQGNAYAHALLTHGPRAALLVAQRCQACTLEKLTQLQCWAAATAAHVGHNEAAITLANKLVRICWAVWCHEWHFNGNWQSTEPA